MKIIAVFGSLQRGGAETMFMNLFRCLDHNKYQIDFLVKERVDSGYEDEVQKYGSKILTMGSPKKVGMWCFMKQLTAMLKDGSYDIIHAHVNIFSGLVVFAAWQAKIPIRITHSHNTIFDATTFNTFVGKRLIHIFSNRRIACGELAGKALFGKDKFVVLPNGIKTSDFLLKSQDEKRQYKSRLGLDESKKWLLHIGRFVEQKNHNFLMNVFAKLIKEEPSVRLLMCGEGPLQNDMMNKAENLGITPYVKFLGSIPNPNDYLKACDIFVLPSLFEGLPVSVVEAQCASMPCLLSSTITSEVDFDLGLVKFIPLEIGKWQDAIKKQISDGTFVSSEIIKNKFEERHFDVNVNANLLLSLYKNAE